MRYGGRRRVRQQDSPPSLFARASKDTQAHLNHDTSTHRTSWGGSKRRESPAAEGTEQSSSADLPPRPPKADPDKSQGPKGCLKPQSRYEEEGLSLSQPLSLDEPQFMPKPNRDAVIQNRQARREGRQRSRSQDEVASPRQPNISEAGKGQG